MSALSCRLQYAKELEEHRDHSGVQGRGVRSINRGQSVCIMLNGVSAATLPLSDCMYHIQNLSDTSDTSYGVCCLMDV